MASSTVHAHRGGASAPNTQNNNQPDVPVSPAPVYIVHTELADQRGKNTGLDLCRAFNNIVPNQVLASQFYNGIWTIWLSSPQARDTVSMKRTIEMDKMQIEIFVTYPTAKHVPNEKVTFKDLPLWVDNRAIIEYLENQPGIIIKSDVVSARHRDYNNKLTPYFSGDRFVFVKGGMKTAIHTTAIIDYNTCRVVHKSQEYACLRCRGVGHMINETNKCPAFVEPLHDIITIRSPAYVLCNYFACDIKVYGKVFRSSEHAYQWRFLTYLGLHDQADEVFSAKTPGEAREIAHRVPRGMHKDWHTIKKHAMKDVLHAKATYCSHFKDTLLDSNGRQLVECTRDLYWSCGLSPNYASNTHPTYFPGRNKLGLILEQVRQELTDEQALMRQIDTDAPSHIDVTYPPQPQDPLISSKPTQPHNNNETASVPTSSTQPANINKTASVPTTSTHPINDTNTASVTNEPIPTPTHQTVPDSILSSSSTPTAPPSDNEQIDESIYTTLGSTDVNTSGCSNDSEDDQMSGVEELSQTSGDEQYDNDHNITSPSTSTHGGKCTVTEKPPPPPQTGALPRSRVRNQNQKQLVITAFVDRAKRKMTPGKESDVTQDNVKNQKFDTKL